MVVKKQSFFMPTIRIQRQRYFRALPHQGQALTGFRKNHPRFAAVFFLKTLLTGNSRTFAAFGNG
jgi:hypothetical protein